MARLLDEFAGFEIVPGNLSSDSYTNYLERFDNQSLTDATLVNSTEIFTGFSRVTGRIANRSNNAVAWYLNDLDILTVSGIPDPTITLFFTPVQNVDIPYPVGCTVRIENRNNLYSVEVEVSASTRDSITFTNPGNFPSTSNLFIEILENEDSSTLFPITFNYNNIIVTQALQGQVSLNSGTPAVPAVGQQQFTGSSFPFNFFTTFTVPAGVTNISAVAIGGGGGGRVTTNGGTGGNGGDLRYVNNIAVTPGEILTIQVGVAGYPLDTSSTNPGGDSYISRPGTTLVSASGGRPGVINGQSPGSNTGTNIGTGGNGGSGGFPTTTTNASGGGGAGGYSGNGGNGGVNAAGSNGSGGGGGGGGGAGSGGSANRGGGVGLLGEGANGVGGALFQPGLPGSNGVGELYGAGGGGSDSSTIVVGANYGGQGGVRIMWGSGRSYPSTLTADQPTVTFVPEILPFISITERTVDFFNRIRFYDNTYVKISTTSGYSATVQIYNTTTTSFTFIRPVGFPIEENNFIIENASPSVLAQDRALTNFLSTNAPYTFTRPMDRLVSAQISPNPHGARLYSLSTSVQGHVDNRKTSGQLLPRSNIKGVEPTRQSDVLTKFTVRADTIAEIFQQSRGIAIWNPLFAAVNGNLQTQRVDDYDPANFYFTLFIGGIYQLTGVTLTIDPGGNSVVEAILADNQFRLESYDDIGIYEDLNLTAISQNNVFYNTVANYIQDLDSFSYNLAAPAATQILYFRYNEEQPKLVAYPGHRVQLFDSISQYSTVVQVTESTVNSITFVRPFDFPNNYENQFAVKNATVFYYPKELVFNSLISSSLPFVNLAEPKENLFVSEYKPTQQQRTISYYIDREFQDTLPLLINTQYKLETFATDNRLPSDFRVAVVGENTGIVYDTVNWYIDDEDQLAFSLSPITVKILYFGQTETLLFKPGDSVRIYNNNNNFDITETVIASDASSISIIDQGIDRIGTSGCFIEVLTTSVYPQAFVNTNTRPTNARENLYYFETVPGYRYNASIQQGFVFDKDQDIPIGKLASLDVLKGDGAVIKSEDAEFLPIFREDRTIVTAGNLNRDSLQVRSDRNGFDTAKFDHFNQFNIFTTTAPQSPRELFYYSRIAPGFKYNRSIEQGNLVDEIDNALSTINLLNKDSLQVRPDRTVLSVAKTASMTALQTDRTVIASAVLNKDIAKIKSDAAILRSGLVASFDIDQKDVVIFSVPESGKLVSAVTAKLAVDKDSLGKIRVPIFVKSSGDVSSLTVIDNTFLQTQVVVQTNPTNSREALYYFNIAPGYRFNKTLQQGLTLSDDTVLLDKTLIREDRIVFPSTASHVFSTADYARLQSSTILKEYTVEDSFGLSEIFKTPTDKTEIFTLPVFGKLASATILRALLINNNLDSVSSFFSSMTARFTIEPTTSAELYFMSLIAPGRKAGNLNTAFGSSSADIEVTLQTDEIGRLKTGEFKPGSVGIGDGAAVRKEPIQFWN